MTPQDAAALIDDIRTGRRDLASFPGEVVQELLFLEIARRVTPGNAIVQATNYRRGPVDFVLEEVPSGLEWEARTSRLHYFEVKHYRRTLELDNVAKILVIGVADQPASINVVSGTALQPQVLKYASAIFQAEPGPRAIFSSVRFNHWVTSHLLGQNWTSRTAQTQAATALLAHRPVLRSWRLIRCLPFSELVLATSSEIPGTVGLDADGQYRIELDTVDAWDATAVALEGLPLEAWRAVDDWHSGSPNHRAFHLAAGFLRPGTSHHWQLAMAGAEGRTVVAMPSLAVHETGFRLPELRARNIESAVAFLSSDGQARLVTLEGDAGVGKTHLGEEVALRLRTNAGIDTVRHTIVDRSPGSLVEELLTAVLTPAFARSIVRGSFQELAHIITRQLAQTAARPGEDLSAPRADVYLAVLAHISAALGRHVLVLKDCHRLDAQQAAELRALIQSLDDLGWSGLRLMLEFRQPEAHLNPSSAALLQWIDRTITSARRIHLRPLDRTETVSLLETLAGPAGADVADHVHAATGGLPLFLHRLLETLVERQMMRRTHATAPWAIDDPLGTLTIVDAGSALAVLEERLEAVLRAVDPALRSEAAAVVGVLAVARRPGAATMLGPWLGGKTSLIATLRTELARHGVGTVGPQGDTAFNHDLLRRAAIRVAQRDPAFTSLATAILRGLTRDNLDALRLLIDLSEELDDVDESETLLQRGVELATMSDDYASQAELLLRLDAKLSGSVLPGKRTQRLHVLDRLAWVEWTAGSSEVARKRYTELEDLSMRELVSQGAHSLAHAMLIEASRRRAGLELELQQSQAFLDAVERVLALPAHPIAFASVLNRLVLYCARFSLPALGQRLASIGLRHARASSPDNQVAVLCSDAGMLWQAADPSAALDIFSVGVSHAQDERQRVHSLVDVLVTQTLVEYRWPSDHLATAWQATTRGHYTGIRTRLLAFEGGLHLRTGQVHTGVQLLQRAKAAVDLYHHVWARPLVAHDMVLAALLSNQHAQARLGLCGLALAMDDMMSQRVTALPRLAGLVDRCEEVSGELPRVDQPVVSLPPAPSYSGRLFDVWTTLQALADDELFHRERELVSRIPCPVESVDYTRATGMRLSGSASRAVKVGGSNFLLCMQ